MTKPLRSHERPMLWPAHKISKPAASRLYPMETPTKPIRAYEIKRGNGQFDAGKIRLITRD
jgi:hypothetical protein